MEPFALYKKIDTAYENDKEFLNTILKIDTGYIGEVTNIDALYKSCEQQLNGFAIDTFCNQRGIDILSSNLPIGEYSKEPLLNMGDPNNIPSPIYKYMPNTRLMDHCVSEYKSRKSLSETTDFLFSNTSPRSVSSILNAAIKNHCIIKALYTIEYISKSKNLTLIVRLMNKFYLTESKNSDLYDKTILTAIRNNHYILFESLNNSNKKYQKQLTTLYSKTRSDGKISRKSSTFLEAFTYKILKNQGRDKKNYFNIDLSISTIINNLENNAKRKTYINNFIEGINRLNNFFNFEKNKPTEKILLNYKKELSFHHDLIWYYYYSKNKTFERNKDFLWLTSTLNNTINTDIFLLSLELPNAFTRSALLNFICNNEEQDQSDLISYFLYVLFPIYERTFFITTYQSFLNDCPNNPVEKMCEYLNAYVEANYQELTKNYLYIPNLLNKTATNYSESTAAINWEDNLNLKTKDEESYNELLKILPEVFTNPDLHRTYNPSLELSFRVDELDLREEMYNYYLWNLSDNEIRIKKQMKIADQYTNFCLNPIY